MSVGNLGPYEALGNAVVLQAVKDYREAVHKLSRGKRTRMQNPRNRNVRDSFNPHISMYSHSLMGKHFCHSLRRRCLHDSKRIFGTGLSVG